MATTDATSNAAADGAKDEFQFKPMTSNSEGIIWSSVVDRILADAETSELLKVEPTSYADNPMDTRDIASINGTRLPNRVPVDFLNDANPTKEVQSVQETLLDVFAIINDGQRPSSEQLRVDVDQLRASK